MNQQPLRRNNMERTTALDYVDGIEGAAAVVTEGTSSFSSEYLAGQYAFDAAREAGDGFADASIEAHLEFLADAGAAFNTSQAIKVAKQFVAAYEND